MPNKRLRKKYFVDKKVQGALVAQAARYWLFSLALVGVLTVLGWIYISPGIGVIVASRELAASILGALIIAVFAALLLFPLFMFDVIRLSHRFAGPMIRLRRAMNQAAAGEHVEPLEFRDKDFWHDFASDFNRLLARIEQDRPARPHGKDKPHGEGKPTDDIDLVSTSD